MLDCDSGEAGFDSLTTLHLNKRMTGLMANVPVRQLFNKKHKKIVGLREWLWLWGENFVNSIKTEKTYTPHDFENDFGIFWTIPPINSITKKDKLSKRPQF